MEITEVAPPRNENFITSFVKYPVERADTKLDVRGSSSK